MVILIEFCFSKTRKAREKQAQQIVSNVDSDGDGKITENEFIDLMHENSKIAAEYLICLIRTLTES